MAELLKGLAVSNKIKEDLMPEIKALKEQGIRPCLAILRIGERADDLAYERGIEKSFSKPGIGIKKFLLEEEVSQKEVLNTIAEINEDDGLQGALLFRPFPKHLNDDVIRNSLSVKKDLDGISDLAMAGIFTGSRDVFPPCTAEACLELLRFYGIPLEGKKVAVIGRSLVIGKPVSMMLLSENATVTICHSRTENLREICKSSDVVLAAVGRAEMIDASYASENTVFIDVGINVNEAGNLVGDINFEEVEPVVQAISPVPRGVGSVTTSILARHLIKACKEINKNNK